MAEGDEEGNFHSQKAIYRVSSIAYKRKMPGKWIYDQHINHLGYINRFKDLVVVKGFNHIKGVTYLEVLVNLRKRILKVRNGLQKNKLL